ncbi:hypothetical protein [Vogesella sp. XCS3]|uniref:hypothetical protein n=1 Tax=Vogesella sp. XCS3 TaxID=2877939 RepID=UPI001D0A93C9|nr:hypothetical protein [Vogesella sp. XCS3]UDM17888.1 hypothetical protein LCH97_04275 [Vogesella sp. XCS3]
MTHTLYQYQTTRWDAFLGTDMTLSHMSPGPVPPRALNVQEYALMPTLHNLDHTSLASLGATILQQLRDPTTPASVIESFQALVAYAVMNAAPSKPCRTLGVLSPTFCGWALAQLDETQPEPTA